MNNISKKMIATSIAALLMASSVTSISFAATEGRTVGEKGGQSMNQQSTGAMAFVKLLTDDEKVAYKELQADLKVTLEELKENAGEISDMSDEEKEEFRADLDSATQSHHSEVRDLLENNTEALNAFETALEKMSEMKGENSEMRSESSENIKGNRAEVKEAGAQYTTERKENTSTLKDVITDAEATALAELRSEYKISVEALKSEQDEDMTDEEKQEIRDEYAALNKAYFENMQDALAGNDEALAVLEEMSGAKSEMKEKVKETKEKNSDERTAFREKRGELVDTYKKSFVTKLGNRLSSIDDSKLAKVIVKIEEMEANLESKGKLTDSLAAQLQALKEIIEDRLDDTDEEELDFDDIFDL